MHGNAIVSRHRIAISAMCLESSDPIGVLHGCYVDLLVYFSIKLKIVSEAEVVKVHGSEYFNTSVFG